MKVEIGARYRHYKGGIYRVITIAKHTETEKPLVIYGSDSSFETWARPLAMFTGTAQVNGQPVPRFTLIADERDQALLLALRQMVADEAAAPCPGRLDILRELLRALAASSSQAAQAVLDQGDPEVRRRLGRDFTEDAE